MEDRKLRTCAGCKQPIEAGQEIPILVTKARHAITVFTHEGHGEAARVNTLERRDWVNDDSYLTK